MDRGKKAVSGVGGGAAAGKSLTKEKRPAHGVAKPATHKSPPDKKRPAHGIAKPATHKSPPDKKRPVGTAAKGKALAGGKPAPRKAL